jgi:hypothetical protein
MYYSLAYSKAIAFGSGVIKSSLDESGQPQTSSSPYFSSSDVLLLALQSHLFLRTANFAEVATQTIKLDYRGIIVGKIVEYLHFKHAYKDTAQKEIQEDFSERIEPELALEL